MHLPFRSSTITFSLSSIIFGRGPDYTTDHVTRRCTGRVAVHQESGDGDWVFDGAIKASCERTLFGSAANQRSSR